VSSGGSRRRKGSRPAPPPSEIWWDPRDRAQYDATALQLLQIAHGFTRSANENLCKDHWGRPVPWISRPVVDFLAQLDLRDVDVFEYGGGASTFYWKRLCRSVVCVESDPIWAKRLKKEIGSGARILLETDPRAFAEAILVTKKTYDIILIDAAPAFRIECVEPALKRLAPRGMIILDDAPFHVEAAARLRNAGLIEVDVTGFTPLEANLQTTSLFLSRNFDIPRRKGRSPALPFGSPGFDWDRFAPEERNEASKQKGSR
jgi:hypothetical protein